MTNHGTFFDKYGVQVNYREFPVLVVDDERDILESFRMNYEDDFTIVTAEDGSSGLKVLATCDPAVIVADQRMPTMTGAEFLERSVSIRPDAVRIILTGFSDLDGLIEAVNKGKIYHYIAKPWNSDELRVTLKRGVEVFHLTRENARLVEELRRANERLSAENRYLRRVVPTSTIVGNSSAIRAVLEQVRKVAQSSTTVLIEGETGTGKELVARAIHDASGRSGKLFVAVNCAELSEGILESELFGHRRGAFTGAAQDKKGLFEVADGGTLFLDEISETPQTLQAKLLRVLEEGEIRPVGETRPRRVDVRVIAATNRVLEEEVRVRRFRKDLYYRLKVFPIRVPPLRDRREDIPALVDHFLKRLSAELKKAVGRPTAEALSLLSRYSFPGNVRELSNELERAILLAESGAPLSEDLLSDHVQETVAERAPAGSLQSRTGDFERAQIEAALAKAGGVKTRAAEELGITYRGLLKKMKRLGM